MKRIYVAGAYSSNNIMGVFANMRRGMTLAREVLDAGFAPFCPWHDYHYILQADADIEVMYSYSMAWLEASDAVIVQPIGWRESRGTLMELARAEALGLPVFHSMEELNAWEWKEIAA